MIALFWLAAQVLGDVDSAAVAALSLVGVVAILVGMPTIIETMTRGRSVGKIAAGLRVVRDDGGPVRFRHAFVRALFMIVDFWLFFGAVGLITSLISSKGKRLGDHFAGTVVIRERVPAAAAMRMQTYSMPPALEGWASSLDLTRLPDVTVMQTRQFLSRASTIDLGVRSTMGLQLAAEISSYVAPPPPPGTPPEIYLTAVLTERMRRATTATQARPVYLDQPTFAAPPTLPATPQPPAQPSPAGTAGPGDSGPFTLPT
jgi:uncharacterized RDD family membrane protein YckC